ncbi:MAG: carbon monoxide dehydrogenase subunit G [Ottowia sp.]|uniref:CoxG family protein n=1 Tax=unclassified Ottowia TaxID=2645081 RepID=UPI003C2AE6F2
MKLTGERIVPAGPAQIWSALLDPETLKACIPGCDELERTGNNAYRAAMVSKVGPIKARFAGQVALDDSRLPDSCTLTGEGTGGVAGFVKGAAAIRVEPAENGSRLIYDAEVEIGGKIASLGDRLFRGVVERNITQLFDVFEKRLSDS